MQRIDSKVRVDLKFRNMELPSIDLESHPDPRMECDTILKYLVERLTTNELKIIGRVSVDIRDDDRFSAYIEAKDDLSIVRIHRGLYDSLRYISMVLANRTLTKKDKSKALGLYCAMISTKKISPILIDPPGLHAEEELIDAGSMLAAFLAFLIGHEIFHRFPKIAAKNSDLSSGLNVPFSNGDPAWFEEFDADYLATCAVLRHINLEENIDASSIRNLLFAPYAFLRFLALYEVLSQQDDGQYHPPGDIRATYLHARLSNYLPMPLRIVLTENAKEANSVFKGITDYFESEADQ